MFRREPQAATSKYGSFRKARLVLAPKHVTASVFLLTFLESFHLLFATFRPATPQPGRLYSHAL